MLGSMPHAPLGTALGECDVNASGLLLPFREMVLCRGSQRTALQRRSAGGPPNSGAPHINDDVSFLDLAGCHVSSFYYEPLDEEGR